MYKNKKIKRLLSGIIVILIFLIFNNNSYNSENILTLKEKLWLKKNYGKIRLGPDPNAPPLDFFDKHDESYG